MSLLVLDCVAPLFIVLYSAVGFVVSSLGCCFYILVIILCLVIVLSAMESQRLMLLIHSELVM